MHGRAAFEDRHKHAHTHLDPACDRQGLDAAEARGDVGDLHVAEVAGQLRRCTRTHVLSRSHGYTEQDTFEWGDTTQWQ
eukprot:10002-Eustigmatos_ZCMA.PRE.1